MAYVSDAHHFEAECVVFTFSHAEWSAIYNALEGDRPPQRTVWDALNRSAPST